MEIKLDMDLKVQWLLMDSFKDMIYKAQIT